MNDLNFRSLQKLKVPDELMEKLNAIPENEEKKPAVIPFWRNRAVIAAAGLVLVSLISLIVYFSIGNKPDLPLTILPSSTEQVWETDAHGETIVPDVESTPTVDDKDVVATRPNESTAISQTPSETIGHGGVSPTTETKPTENDRRTPTAVPDHVPVEKPTEPPSVIEPTEELPDPVLPTEPPEDNPPPWELPDPTVPADDPPPVLEPTEALYTDTISEVIYVGDMSDENVIYCWLYYNQYRMYGEEAYTDKFAASVTPLGDGYVYLSYTPKAHGVMIPQKGQYSYLWYLSDNGGSKGRRLNRGKVYLNE